MQSSEQRSIRGTRTHQDFDIIVVGAQTLFVPTAFYGILDEMTCGDQVEATYKSDHTVVSLRQVS